MYSKTAKIIYTYSKNIETYLQKKFINSSWTIQDSSTPQSRLRTYKFL